MQNLQMNQSLHQLSPTHQNPQHRNLSSNSQCTGLVSNKQEPEVVIAPSPSLQKTQTSSQSMKHQNQKAMPTQDVRHSPGRTLVLRNRDASGKCIKSYENKKQGSFPNSKKSPTTSDRIQVTHRTISKPDSQNQQGTQKNTNLKEDITKESRISVYSTNPLEIIFQETEASEKITEKSEEVLKHEARASTNEIILAAKTGFEITEEHLLINECKTPEPLSLDTGLMEVSKEKTKIHLLVEEKDQTSETVKNQIPTLTGEMKNPQTQVPTDQLSDEKHGPIDRLTVDKQTPIEQLPDEKQGPVDRLTVDDQAPIEQLPDEKQGLVDRLTVDEQAPKEQSPDENQDPVDRLTLDDQAAIEQSPDEKQGPVDRLTVDEQAPIEQLPAEKEVIFPIATTNTPDKNVDVNKNIVLETKRSEAMKTSSSRKFHSIEKDIGILNSPPKMNVSQTRKNTSNSKSPPVQMKKALKFPSHGSRQPEQNPKDCLVHLKKAEASMKIKKVEFEMKKKFQMYLPEAFNDYTFSESTITGLYGLFKVSKVIIHYNKKGERLGSGTMFVPWEINDKVKNWVPDRFWRAVKMLPLRRCDIDKNSVRTVKMHLELLPNWPDEKIELFQALLRADFHASDFQMIYDSSGRSAHSSIVLLPYQDAEKLDKLLRINTLFDTHYRVKIFEILDNPINRSCQL